MKSKLPAAFAAFPLAICLSANPAGAQALWERPYEDPDADIGARTKAASGTSPKSARGVAITRLGLRAAGGGRIDTYCEGDCGAYAGASEEYRETPSPLLAAEGLYAVTPAVRLGGGLAIAPSPAVESRDGVETLGTELSPFIVGEAVTPVGPLGSVLLRAQIGFVTLVPGGDLQSAIDVANDMCVSAGGRCHVHRGPYFGYSLGVGTGLLAKSESGPAMRFDLMLEWHRLPTLVGLEGTGANGGHTEAGLTMSGIRVVASLGVEL